QHRGRVQSPAFGHPKGLVPQLVGEHGRPDDDVAPGLHRRERHAAAARGHDVPPAPSAVTGRGTVSHTARATASTSPPGPSSTDPAGSLRPEPPSGQAITRHWSPGAGSAATLAVIRPSTIAVSESRLAPSPAAIPLGQSSAAQTISGRTLPSGPATEESGVHG